MLIILIFIIFGYLCGIYCALKFKNNYHAPNSNIIKKQIFRDNEILYKYKPIIIPCIF